mgnify:CR=1 FL=1
MTLRLREHPPLVLILLFVMCAMLVPVRALAGRERPRA